MLRRANLLIFVLVARALGHREGLPHVQLRPPGTAGPLAQARLDRGPPHARRARHPVVCSALRAERGRGGALVAEELDGIVRAARQGGMIVSTHLANKKLLIKY